MKYIKYIMLVILAIASGCTPYKARDDGWSRIGYAEKSTEDGGYILSYYGAVHNKHKSIKKHWHRRARELCRSKEYNFTFTKEDYWLSDGYAVLPPFVFKSKQAAPTLTGELHCVQASE